MNFLSIFDVIGPNMIGPSSSHTAGAGQCTELPPGRSAAERDSGSDPHTSGCADSRP